MNPPVCASTSRISPAIYNPAIFFASIVEGLISFTLIPPLVMIASVYPLVPVTVTGMFLIRLASSLILEGEKAAARCSDPKPESRKQGPDRGGQVLSG